MQKKGNNKDKSRAQWNKKQENIREKHETKTWFFERVNEIDKPRAKFIGKKKSEDTKNLFKRKYVT